MTNKITGAALLLFLTGCGTSLLDGGATQATIAVKRSTTASPTALVTSGVSVNSAALNVDEIKIKLPEGLECSEIESLEIESQNSHETCEVESELEDEGLVDESEIHIAGPFQFDLMTGKANPSLDNVTLPSGLYRRLSLKVDKAASGDLAGLSFLATGTFVGADANTHNWKIALDFSEELRIENTSDVAVKEQVVNSLVALVNSDQWFDNTDIAACVQSGDLSLDGSDTLVIDKNTNGSGSCSNIKSVIEGNVKNSFSFENESENELETEDNHNGGGSDDPVGHT